MPTDYQNNSTVMFGRVAPTIPVTDMARSLDFYTRILGMKKTFENGTPIGFAIVKSGSAEIHLTLVKVPLKATFNLAHIMVSDATRLFDHLQAEKVRIIKGLRDEEYGLRAFVFADPDGNRIDVGQTI